MQPTPRQTPSASAPRTTPQFADPMPPAAHEFAPHSQRYGRTAARVECIAGY
jgi:hypothetical protein